MNIFVSITFKRHRTLLFECLTHRRRFAEILVKATRLGLGWFNLPEVALIGEVDCHFFAGTL
jgi:hypothetical protein